MVDKILNGVIYSRFNEKVGPEAIVWVPKELNNDILNLVSLKTINILSGEKGKVAQTLAIIPFPSLNVKGLVRSFEISGFEHRGGARDASLTILFDEAMDLIYYKYLKNFEPLIEESVKNIKDVEEKQSDPNLIQEKLNKLFNNIISTLVELRDAEISAQENIAFSKEIDDTSELKGYRFKVVVVGDPAVGKTSIILRFTDKAFRRTYIPTLGVNISEKRICYKNAKIEFIIWDVAGHSKFLKMRKHFYTGSDGLILVFDLTQSETLKNVNNWYNDVVKFLKEEEPIKGLLLGNKSDLLTNGSENSELAQKLANSLDIPYLETSALTGENIDDAFYKLAKLLYNYSLKKSHEKFS
ncbi:MAG: Rab family GTPase [Candidatus Helarchaeota archaeon]